MSVNLNPGLFAQNFQVKNNAVKRAPAAGLTTPLAGDRVDFSFKKAQNKVGFGNFMGKATQKVAKDYGAKTVETVKKLADAIRKGSDDLVDELEDTLLIVSDRAKLKGHFKPEHAIEIKTYMPNSKNLLVRELLRDIRQATQT